MKNLLLLTSLATLNPTPTTEENYKAKNSISAVINAEIKDIFNLDTKNSIPFSRQNLNLTSEQNNTTENNTKIDYIKKSDNYSLNNTPYMKNEIQNLFEALDPSSTFKEDDIEIINPESNKNSNTLNRKNTSEENTNYRARLVVDTISLLITGLMLFYSYLKGEGGNKKGKNLKLLLSRMYQKIKTQLKNKHKNNTY